MSNKIEDETLEDFTTGKVPYLNIEGRTWYRDSHGLYDYDSQHIVRNKMKLFLSCHLNKRDDDKIEISKDVYLRDSDLTSIAYMGGKYYMYNAKGYMWQVIKSTKRFGHKAKNHRILQGDVLKLGRYIFEVKSISSQGEKANMNQSLDNTEIDYKQGIRGEASGNLMIPRVTTINTGVDYGNFKEEQDDAMNQNRPQMVMNSSQGSCKENTCRICLSDEFDSDNPMISPCK